MEQTVHRLSDAEVLDSLARGTHKDATIRQLYQRNFRSLSEYIFHHKGTGRDVRNIVQEAMVHLVWLVRQGRFPPRISVEEFLARLTQALWQQELKKRGSLWKTEEPSKLHDPSAEAAIQAVLTAREQHLHWVRSVDLLGDSCKATLLQHFHHPAGSAPSVERGSDGKVKAERAQLLTCLKKLDELLMRPGRHAQQVKPDYKRKSPLNEELLQYVEGSTGHLEVESYRETLNQSHLPQEDVVRLRQTIDAVQYYAITRQVASLQTEIMKEFPAESTRQTGRVLFLKRLVRIGLAVSAIVFLALLLMAGYHFYRLSTEKLYQEAYVEYPISIIQGGKTPPLTIEEAYRQQDYKAVKKMSKKKRGYTDREFLLIGLSYLHLDDASSAIEPLRWVTIWPGSSYKPDAEYYLAMAYLRDKDYDKAMELMQKIRNNPEHLYYDQFPQEYIRKVRLLKWR